MAHMKPRLLVVASFFGNGEATEGGGKRVCRLQWERIIWHVAWSSSRVPPLCGVTCVFMLVEWVHLLDGHARLFYKCYLYLLVISCRSGQRRNWIICVAAHVHG